MHGYYYVPKEDTIWFEVTSKAKGLKLVVEKVSKNGHKEYSIGFEDAFKMDNFNDTIRNSSNIIIY